MSVIVVEQEDKLDYINVNSIKFNESVALRAVDRKNPEYIELADSVRKDGVLLPIRVRAMTDTETGEQSYGLIDGLQRLTASKDAGKETIPAIISSRTDDEVEFEQVLANVVKVETKPVEYSKKLARILEANPTMTCANLAARLSKSDTWIKDRLRLTQLSAGCAKLVDEGVINIANAYALAKLPPDEQDLLSQQAQTLPADQFVPMVVERKKQLEKAKREGNAGKMPEFMPRQFMRKIGDIQTEADSSAIGKAYIASQRITTPEAAWELALLWTFNADPAAVAGQKAKFDETQAAEADKRQKAADERERRRLAAVNTKADRARLELKLTEDHKSAEEIAEALAAFDAEHKPAKKVAATEGEAAAE